MHTGDEILSLTHDLFGCVDRLSNIIVNRNEKLACIGHRVSTLFGDRVLERLGVERELKK